MVQPGVPNKGSTSTVLTTLVKMACAVEGPTNGTQEYLGKTNQEWWQKNKGLAFLTPKAKHPTAKLAAPMTMDWL